MKRLEKRILILFLLVVTGVNAQIGIGTKTPHQDAMLEVASTNKGLLLPRVALTATTSSAPLNNHVAGMSVYNTATVADVTAGYYYNDGTRWIKLSNGSVGPQGPAGANGSSAYQIALANGYVGTEAQWLVSLQGVAGATGPQGPIGLTGPAGAVGAAGPQGIQGLVGPAGANGTNGLDGKTVLNGTTNPVAGIGANGDFYINTTSNTMFGPKVAGAWPASGTSLVGPAGSGGSITGTAPIAVTSGVVSLNDLGIDSVKLADASVTSAKIADGTITAADLSQMAATSGQVLKWNGTAWAPAADAGLTTTTVSNSITSGALTTTVNGVAATSVTLPVADGSETKVNAGTNVTVTGSGTSISPYVVNASGAVDATSTANGIVRLAGDLSGTAALPTITNSAVINKVLTGYTSTAGTVAATDNIVTAIGKLDGNTALKAPIASPTFTGTPTLPTGTIGVTQTAGNNTTALATTAFVATAVTAAATPDADATTKGKVQLAGDLSGTAALPTITNSAVINKVLTGYTSTAGTVAATDNIVTAIGKLDGNTALKAPIASPTFTGTPTLPTGTIGVTQTAGNNTTALATTAFVTTAVTAAATPDADATTKGKVQLAGDLSGTAALPTIATNAVTSAKIADGTITAADLSQMAATSGQVLKWNGTAWAPAADAGLTTTTVSNSITSGALTTTVNGVAATSVTLPVADGSETKVNAGTNVTVTGSGTSISPYVVNASGAVDATSTANGIVRLAGDLSGTAALPTITNSAVINKVLTGYTSTAGTVAATDNIVTAIGKLDGNTALKAPIASPTFTGTPTLPTGTIGVTQTAGNNTTALATTAFVATAVTAAATPDADATTKGKVQLAGDLSGTAALPTIATNAVTSAKIADNAVTISKLPSGASSSTFLRGDGTWVTLSNYSSVTLSKDSSYTALNAADVTPNSVTTITFVGSSPANFTISNLPTGASNIGKILNIYNASATNIAGSFNRAGDGTAQSLTINGSRGFSMVWDGQGWARTSY